VSEYTPAIVKNLLNEYLRLREFLWEGTAQQSPMPQFTRKFETKPKHRIPLGGSNQSPFPFMEKSHASVAMDGKKRARSREELLAMLIDLETGLSGLSPDNRELVIKYFILDTIDLNDISKIRGFSATSSSSRLMEALLIELTRRMNNDDKSTGKT